MSLDYGNVEAPYEWWRKAKDRGTWDPEAIDLTQDKIDFEESFTEPEQRQFIQLCALFYEGEESVTRTLAPYPMAVGALENPGFDTLQEEMFLTTQIWEEAKHTEFFSRYFADVFGTQNTDHGPDGEEYWNPELRSFLLDELDEAAEELMWATTQDQQTLRHTLAMAVMHYMGLVEAELARVGYEGLSQMLSDRDLLPGFQKGIEKVQEDEGRHIANGRWLLAQLAESDPTVIDNVYEPMLERFFGETLGPTIDHVYGNNELNLDMDMLLQKAQGNYQSTVDAIGSERFSDRIEVAGD